MKRLLFALATLTLLGRAVVCGADPITYDLSLPGVTGSITTDGTQGVLVACIAPELTCYHHPTPQNIVNWNLTFTDFNVNLTRANSFVKIIGQGLTTVENDLDFDFNQTGLPYWQAPSVVIYTPINILLGNDSWGLAAGHESFKAVGTPVETFALSGKQVIGVAVPEPATFFTVAIGLLSVRRLRRLR